jgi:AcrR family transcriptional regulator
VSRPYETLLAKGEDRRQHILDVALRLMTRGGGRATTLGQVAREAGMSTAGLLHHFPSKEQLLHAVLDARDAQDEARSDFDGDLDAQLRGVRRRFDRSPAGGTDDAPRGGTEFPPGDNHLVGVFVVLLCESLDTGAPLHERFLGRYRSALRMLAGAIRRGQQSGRFRAEVDADVKAREIVAFLYGIEATWLLDPQVPVAQMLAGYTRTLIDYLSLPGGEGKGER